MAWLLPGATNEIKYFNIYVQGNSTNILYSKKRLKSGTESTQAPVYNAFMYD